MNDVLAYALLLSRDADSPEAGERDAAALLDLFGDKKRLNAAVSELAGSKGVREERGPPPWPGAVFDTTSHRWKNPKTNETAASETAAIHQTTRAEHMAAHAGKRLDPEEDTDDIAVALRDAMEKAVGDPKDQCIACAYALKSQYPEAEIWVGTVNGETHTVAKLGGKYIDVTADQFGDFDTVQTLDPEDLPREYRRFVREEPNIEFSGRSQWHTQDAVTKSLVAELAAKATENAGDRHQTEVHFAAATGKHVPPEVLADYPEIAAKFAKRKTEDKGNLVPKKITDKIGRTATHMVDPTKGQPAADTTSPSRPDSAPVPVDHADATAEVAAMPGLSDEDRTGLVGAIKGIFAGGKRAVLIAKAVASAVHEEAKLWATRLALAGVTYEEALPNAKELSNPLTGSTSATGGVDMVANATGVPGAQYALAKIAPKIATFAVLKVKSLLAGKRSEAVDATPDAEPVDRDELIRQFRAAILRAISSALTTADAEDDDPAEPEPVREARLLSENFTGRKKDSAGRMRCYQNGKLVPCPDLKAAATPAAKKGGTPAAPAKGTAASTAKPGTGMPIPAKAKPAGGKNPARPKMPDTAVSEKALRAKASQVRTDKTIQRYAEEYVEPQFAGRMDGASFPNSEPVDVALPADPKNLPHWQATTDAHRQALQAWVDGGKKGKAPTRGELVGAFGHGVELKTMVLGKDEKLTMNAYAQVRKRVWREEHGVPFHTVVVDDRKVYDEGGNHDETERTYYYRRGIAGSARVMGMHKVEGGVEELKRLMAMAEDDLPDAAKTKEKDWLTTGTWEPLPSGERGYVNTETGQEVRPKK